jgi:hypothetical protein
MSVSDVETDAGSTGMTMREFHDQAADDGADTGADSGAHAHERGAGDSRSPGLATVQDAETRTDLALAYRRRVAGEGALTDPGEARSLSGQGRHSVATTGTEGDHAVRTRAEQDADSWGASHRGEHAQRREKADKTEQSAQDGGLPVRARDLPNARDVVPNIRLAEVDIRKLDEYSLNPGHPGNNGKANGWRALGYDVDTSEGRRDAARELCGLIREEPLAHGKVAKATDTEYGPSYAVHSRFTGPNGRQATLVSCWLVQDRSGLAVPQLTTVLVKPHRDKETER